MTVLWPALAALAGGLVAVPVRLWIGWLRRGATIRAGWLEVPAAVISGVGVALAPPGLWALAFWVGLLTVTLSAIDLRHHRLPDAITLPAAPITLLVVLGTAWLAPGTGVWWRGALGGVVLGGAFYLLAVAAPAGMGRGDAKLAVSIGVALGFLSWGHLLVGVFLGFALGALAGLVGIVARRFTLRSAIPFGPALLLGCWLTVVVGPIAGLAR